MEELDLKELLQIFWEKKLQIILIIAISINVIIISKRRKGGNK